MLGQAVYYHLAPGLNNDADHAELHLTGSPGDMLLFQMYTEATTNYQTGSSALTYDLYTEIRNSGSPVWILKDGVYTAVGVHSRGGKPCNMAVEITPEVYQQIRDWCASVNIDL